MNAAVKRPKRPSKPVYLECRRVVLPETGEEVRAWVASTEWDARAMKARGYKSGSVVRADFRKPRNTKFNGLAHVLGALIADHVEGYEGMDAHDALKKMQRECGTCCEEIEIDLGPAIGKVKARQARSIAFDEMDQTEFSQLVLDVCAHVRKVCPGVPDAALSEIIASIEEGHA